MFIQIILTAILVAMLLVTMRRAYQSVIPWREAIGWSALWIVAAVIILLPQTTSIIANLTGVGRGVDLVVYVSVTLLFVLVFRLFLTLDRLDQTLTELVRRDALRDAKEHESHR